MAVNTEQGSGMATESNRADPGRILDLLWGVQQQPTRGPKPGLTLEQIVRTGVEIADAEGVAAVSMRRIADQLGFTTMSLYRYVPSKTDLLELMVDNASTVGEPHVPGGDWRARLRWWVNDVAAIYRARPWLLDVPLNSPPMGPNQVLRMERALEALDDTGLDGGEMLGVLVLLSGFVRGHAQLASTLAQAESRTGAAEREWDLAYGRMLRTFVNPGDHPVLARIVASNTFEEFDQPAVSADQPGDEWLGEDFEFGRERVLDGIAAYIAERNPSDDVTRVT